MLSGKKVKKFIEKKANYWSKVFDVEFIEITANKDKDSCFWVGRYKYTYKYFYLDYVIKNVIEAYSTYDEILFVIFHEIGHVFHRAFHSSVGKVEAEYLAELFAVKQYKKYFPEKWEKVRQLQIKKLPRMKPVYQKAFKRIKDYHRI